jgi:fatty acid desaturase
MTQHKDYTMKSLRFTPRSELSDYEWIHEGRNWKRPDIDKETMTRLLERSTLQGLLRVGAFLFFLLGSAAATLIVAQYSLWLAIPLLYVYYFFFGFWVAIGHELQHSTVFSRSANWLNEILFYTVQTLMWNSPTYARKSHQLHHRYTMVRGVDPETDWPEVITTKFVKSVLLSSFSQILVIGAPKALYRDIALQVKRIAGHKDRMMTNHCSDKDNRTIRRESLAILLVQMGVVALAIIFHRWELLLFITIAWQIGSPIEGLWHNTEHIARLYNVNDQRLCTRSVKVGPLIHLIYWGLDDHVDHHIFPVIPSRNLPRLHKILQPDLPEPPGLIACWREMFAVAQEKDSRPQNEYVPYEPILTQSATNLKHRA